MAQRPSKTVARTVPSRAVPKNRPTTSRALANERPDGRAILKAAQLERFENRTRHRRYTIEFSCPEFTCICPMSGFPDFATLHIKYVPDQYCVELKSLKLYINKYRNEGVFHEDVVNVVMDDLVDLLDPFEIEIVGDFNVRGNIKTVITARHAKGDRRPQRKVAFDPGQAVSSN
ncbi:MAG: NADPH-dependent 7-cyano-7-deazaguanine reductase QueF [Bdellovibrionales bacterium]|nr:NADPH-dependent 7-cyano-7-deazaguanine reductase QueF [Bdellovibrionales bacterium]